MEITALVKDYIKQELDKKAAADQLFAKNYAKENKSLDECVRYVFQEAEKACRNNPKTSMGGGCGAAFSEEEVLNTALHYFDEDDIKVEGPKSQVGGMAVKETKTETKTEAPKAKRGRKPKAQPVPAPTPEPESVEEPQDDDDNDFDVEPLVIPIF